VKSILKRIAISSDLIFLRFFVWIELRRSNKKTFERQPLCFSLEGRGNLGSRALLEAASAHLPPQTFFLASDDNLKAAINRPDSKILILEGLYPNFSYTHFKSLISVSRRIAQSSELHIIGADNMDGAYSDSLSGLLWNVAIACQVNRVQTNILGFSWNKFPTTLTRRRFASAAKTGVILNLRDSLSFDRARMISNVANVRHTSDIVFGWRSLDSNSSSGLVLKSAGYQILLVGNPGFTMMGADYSLDSLAPLFEALGSDSSIILVPSVIRPKQDDQLQQLRIKEHFGQKFNVRQLKAIPSTADYLELVKSSKLVVTFRMHPAILSLKVGTPVVMFDYQDKMAGLASDLEIQDFCVTSLDWIADGAKAIETALMQSQESRSRIEKLMPAVLLRSESNWDLEFHGHLP